MLKTFVDTSVLLRFLVKDDDLKAKACEKLLRESKQKGVSLHLLPVAVMEIVWVLEKVYKFDKKQVREVVEAVLNTPELKVDMESVFREALAVYAEKNVKFADALMAFWAMDKGIATVYTYDEKDFGRIEGLEVRKPS